MDVVNGPASAGGTSLAARIAALPRKSRLDLEGLVRAIEKREREQRPTSRLAAKLEAELAAAEAAAAARKAIRWRIEYPPELPIAQARELILDALDTRVARHRSRLGRFVPDGPAPRRYP